MQTRLKNNYIIYILKTLLTEIIRVLNYSLCAFEPLQQGSFAMADNCDTKCPYSPETTSRTVNK